MAELKISMHPPISKTDLSIMNQDSQNWFKNYDTVTTSYFIKHHLFYFIDRTFDYMRTAIINFVNQAAQKKYL